MIKSINMNKTTVKTMNTSSFKIRNVPFVYISEWHHGHRIGYIKAIWFQQSYFERLSVWAVIYISQRLILN